MQCVTSHGNQIPNQLYIHSNTCTQSKDMDSLQVGFFFCRAVLFAEEALIVQKFGTWWVLEWVWVFPVRPVRLW